MHKGSQLEIQKTDFGLQITSGDLMHDLPTDAYQNRIHLTTLLDEFQIPYQEVTKPLSIRIHKDGGSISLTFGIQTLGKFYPIDGDSGLGTDGKRVFVCGSDAVEELWGYLSETYGISNSPISLPELFLLRLDPPPNVLVDEVEVGDVLDDEPSDDRPTSWSSLYEYQKTGYRFLNFAASNGSGAILGDEMGLGKTAQVIALLESKLRLENGDQRALVVVPATLVVNWQRELRKFASGLSFHVHYGSKRSFDPAFIRNQRLVVTTYETLVNDLVLFNQFHWDYCVIDEAQNIKNPGAARTDALKRLRRGVSIAVTGTPFENHVTDLWSLVDFVMPGRLGSLQSFEASHSDDLHSARLISEAIKSLVIRRMVLDVREDLPEKIEIDEVLTPPSHVIEKQLEILATGRLAGSLTRLLVISAHGDADLSFAEFENSPKVQRLGELLDEIYANGHRVLIFSSFSQASERLRQWHQAKYPDVFCEKINGSTPVPQRQALVDELGMYQTGSLVLNPTAGGVGLNITSANHVIHFNPEWNPAKTDQATARAYRGGQELPVSVHHFYYEGTVEELVASKQALKRSLAVEAVPVAQPEMSIGEVFDWLAGVTENV
jgi:SNF2 family DNA or RNA helicase